MTPKEQILKDLLELSSEDQDWILNQFCKDCHKFIGDEKDWSGDNLCVTCSSDPQE